jgi:hypothetical protein
MRPAAAASVIASKKPLGALDLTIAAEGSTGQSDDRVIRDLPETTVAELMRFRTGSAGVRLESFGT